MKEILDIQYHKTKLANGLDVVLFEEHSLPITAVNIWYMVGSANEVKTKTGLAHLFEHMMFQGSLNVPKEMHFKYIQEAGGTLNASTSFDKTNYYNTLPSNELETALWLESDRMGYFIPALTEEKLENQRDVVMNERNQRYDNQPYGLAWEILLSNLFPEGHPYSWPTIGWMDDIKGYTLEDVKRFFNTFYSPNNASLVIGGDINIDKTLKLVDKYFAPVKVFNDGVTKPSAKEFKVEHKKVIHEEDIQLPRIYFAWKSDTLYADDDASLDVLAEIIGGSKNSRLQKKLIFDDQLVQDVSCFQLSAKVNGAFIIAATGKPGSNLDEIKSAILSELDKLKTSGLNEKEITRSVNSIKSSHIYSFQNLTNLANQINNYNVDLNEPNSFAYDFNRYNNLNKDSIEIIANTYLTNEFVELHIVPKES